MKRTMTKRKKKTKIGSSLLVLAILLAPAAFAEKKKAAKPDTPAGAAYGMIGVTVFREPGFALPGASIALIPEPAEPLTPAQLKKVTRAAESSARGEYVFRVPVQAMKYKVRAAAKGLIPQEKSVSIEGGERIDVTFLLAPESK